MGEISQEQLEQLCPHSLLLLRLGAAPHSKSWLKPEPSGWQQLLLAAAFPELGMGTLETAEFPLLFPLCWSLNSKPRLSLVQSGTSSFSSHPALQAGDWHRQQPQQAQLTVICGPAPSLEWL